MTLILSVQTQGSVWLVADRRLSSEGITRTDKSTKVTILETSDGIAIIGYAGIGATALGNQPSDWVSKVLRGRKLPLEASLKILSDAMTREFPPHLKSIRSAQLRQHRFIVSAFLNGQHRVYIIEMAEKEGEVYTRHTRLIRGGALTAMQLTPSLTLAGSGALALGNDSTWQRPLLRLIKAYNAGKITQKVVSKFLAELCQRAHQNTKDGSVGPSCIVVWRNLKNGQYKGGGGFGTYEGLKQSNGQGPPTIANGMDMPAITGILMRTIGKAMKKRMEDRAAGNPSSVPELDKDEINRRLARLPSDPDEKLR